jgi:hypothetical protein
MRALIFLYLRTFVNSVKRAVSSPTRLLGVLFFFGYYLLVFSPFTRGSPVPQSGIPERAKFPFPPLDVIEAVTFGGFVAVTIFMGLGIFTYRGGFKPNDVDVLFPTPLSPKLVLLFRLVRDTLVTLIVPLVFALLVWRPASAGWDMLFRDLPDRAAGDHVIRAAFVAYLLIALAWTSIGYAATLYVHRPDAGRRRKWGAYAGLILSIALVVGYVVWRLARAEDGQDVLDAAQAPLLRTTMFLATFGTWLSMAPLRGDWGQAALGFGALVATIFAAVALALRQHQWVYEQAALQASVGARNRALQQRGDVVGMAVELAKQGRVKVGRQGWIQRWRPVGGAALLWKEAILQWRVSVGLLLMMPAIGIVLMLLPLLLDARTGGRGTGPAVVFMQALAVFIATASVAQAGFLETLRRVDLQKPLPFAPARIVFFEVLAKAALGGATALLGSLITVAVKPELWQWALGAALVMPSLSVLLSGVFFLASVLFPDMDDPTQRGFRGLITMIALIVFCGPAGLLFVALATFVPVWLAALPAAAMNLGMALVAAHAGGRLYLSYNPSE